MLSIDPFFANCSKFYCLDHNIIEFAKNIIREILVLKHLNEVCSAFKITCTVLHVDEKDKQQSPQEYGIGKSRYENFPINLIFMFEYYMPNITVNKSDNDFTNQTFKLSILMSILLKRTIH
jgi:hypothetical protein